MSSEHRAFEQESIEAMERLKHAIGFAMAGLQALILINGGALVALFTFVGSSNVLRFDLGQIWLAFAGFASGLVFDLLAFLAAHMSQDCFYQVAQFQAWNADLKIDGRSAAYQPLPRHRQGVVAQYVAMICAILSLLAFIGGCGAALAGVIAA